MTARSKDSEGGAQQRPFIGMHFKCCNVYARIYLSRTENAFTGGCPRCGKPIRIEARPGGSKSRFWSAG